MERRAITQSWTIRQAIEKALETQYDLDICGVKTSGCINGWYYNQAAYRDNAHTQVMLANTNNARLGNIAVYIFDKRKDNEWLSITVFDNTLNLFDK